MLVKMLFETIFLLKYHLFLLGKCYLKITLEELGIISCSLAYPNSPGLSSLLWIEILKREFWFHDGTLSGTCTDTFRRTVCLMGLSFTKFCINILGTHAWIYLLAKIDIITFWYDYYEFFRHNLNILYYKSSMEAHPQTTLFEPGTILSSPKTYTGRSRTAAFFFYDSDTHQPKSVLVYRSILFYALFNLVLHTWCIAPIFGPAVASLCYECHKDL